MEKSSPSLAKAGGERPDLDEGRAVPDRIHVAEPQARHWVFARDRPSVDSKNQDQNSHDSREGTGT